MADSAIMPSGTEASRLLITADSKQTRTDRGGALTEYATRGINGMGKSLGYAGRVGKEKSMRVRVRLPGGPLDGTVTASGHCGGAHSAPCLIGVRDTLPLSSAVVTTGPGMVKHAGDSLPQSCGVAANHGRL